MKTLKILLSWCLLVSTLAACNTKEEDAVLPVVPTSKTDYLPTSPGSEWTYGGISPYTLTVTGAKKDFNGNTFYELETIRGTTTNKLYVAKEKGVYNTIGLVNGLGNSPIMILNETTTVGQSWVQTCQVNGFDVQVRLTVEETGITKTIGSNTFDKVIHVKMYSNQTYQGADMGFHSTTNYYFAQGVGLILIDLGRNGQVPLLNYKVN